MPVSTGSIEVCFEAVRARGSRRVALLIGAGCSATAGIPTAAEFVKIIHDRWPERCKGRHRGRQTAYEWATRRLAPGEFRKLFAEFAEKANFNLAHLCVAELLFQGIVDRVLTTNFDSLAMQACARGRGFPLIHDCSTRDKLDEWLDEDGSAIFYLHGYHQGRKMLNPAALRRRGKRVSRIVMGTIRRRLLIICGYSGQSDQVFEELQRATDIENTVFWIDYGNDSGIAEQFRKSRLRDRIYILGGGNGYGADEFFYELLLACGKNPPVVTQADDEMWGHFADRINWPYSVSWDAWRGARVSTHHRAPPGLSDDRFKDLKMKREPTPWAD